MTTLAHIRPSAATRGPRLATLAALYRSRRALAALDAAQLDDIGITPGEARAEAQRSVWDLPRAWRAARC